MYLKNYVPRHLRLGVCCTVPDIVDFHEVIESIPVVDDNGDVVSTTMFMKEVPASEQMSKYRLSAFRLKARIQRGIL